MKQDPTRRLLERLEADEILTNDELLQLQQQLALKPELTRGVLDQRAINGLLQLLSSDAKDDEVFVSNCINRLRDVALPRTNLADEFELEILEANALETVARHTKQASTERKRVTSSTTVTGLLVVAACLLLAIGAWGLYLLATDEMLSNNLAQADAAPTATETQDDAIATTILATTHPDNSPTDLADRETAQVRPAYRTSPIPPATDDSGQSQDDINEGEESIAMANRAGQWRPTARPRPTRVKQPNTRH